MSSGTFEVLLLALRRAKRGGSPSIETQRGKNEAFCFNLLCFRWYKHLMGWKLIHGTFYVYIYIHIHIHIWWDIFLLEGVLCHQKWSFLVVVVFLLPKGHWPTWLKNMRHDLPTWPAREMDGRLWRMMDVSQTWGTRTDLRSMGVLYIKNQPTKTQPKLPGSKHTIWICVKFYPGIFFTQKNDPKHHFQVFIMYRKPSFLSSFSTWEPPTPTPTSSAVTAADPPNPPAIQQERMLHRPAEAEAEADATYLGRMGKTFSTQIDGKTQMPPWQSRLRWHNDATEKNEMY